MSSVAGFILGLINIALIVVLLLLAGAAGHFIFAKLGWAPDAQVRNLYIAFVALVGLYMLFALVFGFPSVNLFRH